MIHPCRQSDIPFHKAIVRCRALVVIGGTGICAFCMGCGLSADGRWEAIYKDFHISSTTGGFSLSTGFEGPPSSAIYRQLGDGSVYRLRDLPESVAATQLPLLDTMRPVPGWNTYTDHTSGSLTYHDGRLERASMMWGGWEGLKIGSSSQGPFFRMPLTKNQIVEFFGEPIEWRRKGKPPSGP